MNMDLDNLYVPRRSEDNVGLIVDEDTGKTYTPNDLRDLAASLIDIAVDAELANWGRD